MRRFLPILLALVLSCPRTSAQGKKEDIQQVTITSKKEKVSDIRTRTLKVVLPGEDMKSLALRDAVKNSWSLSPYEFCSVREFSSLRGDGNTYFMFIIEKEKEDGISYLRIAKGGSDDIDKMIEVVTFPLCPSDGGTGREGAYMPAIISIVQEYVEQSLSDGFKSLGSLVGKAPKGGLTLIVDEEDISGIDAKTREKKLSGVRISSIEAAEAIQYGAADTAVAYTISPMEPSDDAVCYKFVFDARTHGLYYFKKHKISQSNGRGFLKGDIGAITSIAR